MKDVTLNEAGTARVSGDKHKAEDTVSVGAELKNVINRKPGVTLSIDSSTQAKEGIEYIDTSGFGGSILVNDATCDTYQKCFDILDASAGPLAVVTSGFGGSILVDDSTCDTVQECFDVLDANAAPLAVVTTGFGGDILVNDATCDTVQECFDVLDANAAPLASPSLTGVPVTTLAGVGTDSHQIASTRFVNDVMQNVGSFLPGAAMASASGAAHGVAGHVGTVRTANASANYAAGTLGPFLVGGTITGVILYHFGEAAGTATVDIAIAVGSYTPGAGDSITSPPSENTISSVGSPLALATPATENILTRSIIAFDSGTVTVVAGDTVSIWIYRGGVADSYADFWNVYGIGLTWT